MDDVRAAAERLAEYHRIASVSNSELRAVMADLARSAAALTDALSRLPPGHPGYGAAVRAFDLVKAANLAVAGSLRAGHDPLRRHGDGYTTAGNSEGI